MRVSRRSLGSAVQVVGLLTLGLWGCGGSDPVTSGPSSGGAGALTNNTGAAGSGGKTSSSAGSNSSAGVTATGTGGSIAGVGSTGTSGSAPGSAGVGATGTASGAGTAGVSGAGVDGNTYLGGGCVNGTTQCTNCIDDDGDGLIDALDPECVGPLDNDEGTYATGIPGDNQDPKWQDCFFDGNSGAGDDGCRYSTGCLTGDVASSNKDCQVDDQCRNYCAKLTPNGCDCFGCCEVYREGVPYHVQLAPSCSADVANDPVKCPACTLATTCANDCGRCELCLGKTTVPADCAPPVSGTGGAPGGGGNSGNAGASTSGAAGASGNSGAAGTSGAGTGSIPPIDHTCSSGATACDANHSCGAGEYCLTGCCITILT